MAKVTLEHRIVPNKLERDFKKGIPGLTLLTDITYLPYGRRNSDPDPNVRTIPSSSALMNDRQSALLVIRVALFFVVKGTLGHGILGLFRHGLVGERTTRGLEGAWVRKR